MSNVPENMSNFQYRTLADKGWSHEKIVKQQERRNKHKIGPLDNALEVFFGLFWVAIMIIWCFTWAS